MYLGFGELPCFWTISLPLKELNLFHRFQKMPCQALAAQGELLGCHNRQLPFPVLPKSPKFCRKRGGFWAHTLPLLAPAKTWIPVILTSTFPSQQILFHLQTELSVSPKIPYQANKKRLWGRKMKVFPRKRAAAPPGATSAVGGWTLQDKNIYPDLLKMIYWQEFPIGNVEQTHAGRSWELLSPLPSLGEHIRTSSWEAVGNYLEDGTAFPEFCNTWNLPKSPKLVHLHKWREFMTELT